MDIKTKNANYWRKNKEIISLKRKEKYKNIPKIDKEELLKKQSESSRRWLSIPGNREKQRQRQRTSNKNSRTECLNYYSNNDIKCACCGESEIKFMSLDHIDGGRNCSKEAKEFRTKSRSNRSGNSLCVWLKKNNFPVGMQVLCHNCNLAKGFYGECHHSTGVEIIVK